MSIVTLTFDLWPPKSIGCILSSRLTCLPSLIKKSTTVKSLLCSQAYFHRCPVWPWPLTSKIHRVHPLITVNMSCKFDKEICNGLVSMVFTSVTIKKVWLSDRQTHARTHTQTDAGHSDPYVPLCFAGEKKLQYAEKKNNTRLCINFHRSIVSIRILYMYVNNWGSIMTNILRELARMA